MFFETIITFLKKYVKGKNGLPFPSAPPRGFRLFSHPLPYRQKCTFADIPFSRPAPQRTAKTKNVRRKKPRPQKDALPHGHRMTIHPCLNFMKKRKNFYNRFFGRNFQKRTTLFRLFTFPHFRPCFRSLKKRPTGSSGVFDFFSRFREGRCRLPKCGRYPSPYN